MADPGGRRRHPPYGSRFFRFNIQIFLNVAASGVGTPPYEVGAPPPPWEILDPRLITSAGWRGTVVTLLFGMQEVVGLSPGLAIRVDSDEDHYMQERNLRKQWCIYQAF